MKIPEFSTGMSKSVQKVISKEDTALNFGSGALKTLLATPTLAALMIEAAVNVIDPLLPEKCITIGKSIEIKHEHPTREGMTVTVTAELAEVNENMLSFEITAYDEIGRIGTGYHVRQIVNYDILMKRVDERIGMLENRP